MRIKATEKYEKKIEELNKQFQLKTNECHEAWMSLTAANEQLEKVRMELDNKAFQTLTLGNDDDMFFDNCFMGWISLDGQQVTLFIECIYLIQGSNLGWIPLDGQLVTLFTECIYCNAKGSNFLK